MYPHREAESRDYYAVPTQAAEPVQAWIQSRQQALDARLRVPMVLGAERVQLATDRCDDLQRQIERVRHLLINAPPWADMQTREALEQRVSRLTAELHAERLSLWADLKPLLAVASDAAVERMRMTWLGELSQLLAPGAPR